MPGYDKLSKYAFINAKLRARISILLSDKVMNNMIKAGSLSESIKILHNTPYRILEEVYEKTGDIKLAELELYKKEVQVFLEMEKYLKNRELDFVKALADRYEIENLKSVIRVWFDRVIRKRNIENASGYLYRDIIHYNIYPDRIINTESLEEVAEILSATPYAQIIRNNLKKIEQTSHIFYFETALDIYYYSQLHEKAEKLDREDSKIAGRMLGIEIDVENISRMVRFRDFYKMTSEEALAEMIPYGCHIDKKSLESAYKESDIHKISENIISRKYKALSSIMLVQNRESQSRLVLLNRMLDQIILYEVKKIKGGIPFNIGIVLAYFVLKKNEMKKVMTILNAKYYNIEESRIKSVIL